MNNLTPALFEGHLVRRVQQAGQWWFSVIDIIAILAETGHASKYWGKMKAEFEKIEVSPFWGKLKMTSIEDGKKYPTDAVTAQGFLRLVQSIPSKRAEPLKLKIAEWANQKLEEVTNPELAIERAIENYEKRGYSQDWIQHRLTGIGTRRELTDEWQDRGVKGWQYGTLTNTLHQGAFGIKPDEHKEIKQIGKRSLRDHCTAEELALTNLVETACRSLHVQNASHGFNNLKQDAEKAGEVGETARNALETALGRTIVSKRNSLEQMKTARTNKIG